MADREKRIDDATIAGLVVLYPVAERATDANRLGYSRAMLDHICSGLRNPKPDIAQRISAESGGRLTVARLCGWKRTTHYPGCRVFDDDPMPLARADGSEVFRDRASDHDAVRYLRELVLDCPSEVRAAVEVVLDHLRPPASEESAP